MTNVVLLGGPSCTSGIHGIVTMGKRLCISIILLVLLFFCFFVVV